MTGIFPRLNLRSRLLLLAVGVELIMLTLLVANSLRLFEAAMLEQTRWQVQQIMPVLSSALKVPVMQRDFATIQSVLDESRATEGIDYLVFVDQDGYRVAASGWADGIPLPAPSNLKNSSLDTLQRYDATLAIQHGGQHWARCTWASTSPKSSAHAACWRHKALPSPSPNWCCQR
ncbi:MAG TPA: hypothetical protein PLN25_04670 [Deltaproteobacteria bacterium]|nr:hypothetical protein [Deltaproteobacteria bacterium]HQB38098.1 hypothetical protein [Deltaproteobacteria bacterium]